MSEQFGTGYQVRWIQLIFKPKVVVAHYPDEVNALPGRSSVCHSVLEITHPDGSVWYMDGSIGQFGVEKDIKNAIQAKANYEAKYKDPTEEVRAKTPSHKCAITRASKKPSLDNFYWENVGLRLNTVLCGLDWRKLRGLNSEEVAKLVFPAAAEEFEGALDLARNVMGEETDTEDSEDSDGEDTDMEDIGCEDSEDTEEEEADEAGEELMSWDKLYARGLVTARVVHKSREHHE